MSSDLTQTALRVHLFGQPRFFVGDAPFKLAGSPKVLGVLAYLLLHREHPVSRESVAFTFWPDDAEETALTNLRRHLNQLKNALPRTKSVTWILANDSTLQWNPEAGLWLDLAEFERLAAGECGYAQAVELYTGDLLEPSYDDWVFPFRERFRAKYLEMLAALAFERRRRRDFGRAIQYLQRILAADPWREDTVRSLMTVQYESGDRASALRLYADFARRLGEEMGAEPMPETMAVRELIVRNEPVAAAETAPRSDEETSSVTTRRFDLPFVGRVHELEQLRAIWTRAARGFGTAVFLAGEAGIGKTRLAEEIRLVAEAEGARILMGATSSPEAFPYQPIAEALRSAQALLRGLNLSAAERSLLGTIVPALAPGIPLDSEREQKRFLAALESCFVRLARSRPLLLVLEDLHWAGEASIAALDTILRRIASSPVLVLATYRSDEVTAAHLLSIARRRMVEEQRATAITLGRLSCDEVQQLAHEMRSSAAERASARQLYEESEGIPLLLVHLLHAREDAPGGAGADGELRHGRVGIRATIARRIEHLPDAARTLAEIASVGGRRFDLDTVRDVSGWSDAEIFDALGVLIDRHFVKELPRGSRLTFGFTHHLVRTALYDGVPQPERALRHRRFACVMARMPAASSELAGEIARHYELGGEPDAAARWYVTAATRAFALHALDEALDALNRGIALVAGGSVLVQLLLLRETVLSRKGDRDAQRADLERLTRIAVDAADGELECDVLYRRSRLAHTMGLRDEESSLIEALRERATAIGSPKHRAQADFAAATRDALSDRYDDAVRAASSALAIWEELGSVEEQVHCLCLLAHVALYRGAIADAEGPMQRARELSEQLAKPDLAASVFWAAAGSALARQQFEACVELCEKAAELYRAIGDREGEADAAVRKASALSRLERFEEALAANEAGAETFAAIGKLQGVAAAQVNAGMTRVRLGDLGGGYELFESARAHFLTLRDARGQVVCEANMAFTRLAAGDPKAAKSIAEQTIPKARRIGVKIIEAHVIATLGAAERDLGEIDAGIEHMELGLALNRTIGRRADLVNDLADLVLGYLQKGDVNAAIAAADEMLSIAEQSLVGTLWPEFIFWAASRAYRAAGDEERAAQLLQRAVSYYRGALEAIGDPATRRHFAAIPIHRELEYEATRTPPAAEPGR
jgi:DNA-binding SARP family transcriptional activator